MVMTNSKDGHSNTVFEVQHAAAMKVIKRLCAKMFYVYEWALYKCIIIIIIII